MKTDQEFLAALGTGHRREIMVGEYILRKFGLSYTHDPTVAPPRSVHNGTFKSKGDLFVETWGIVEVKHRPNHDLRNFHHPTMFLGETYKIDPSAIHGFVVGGKMRMPLWWFPASESGFWTVERTYSKIDRREIEVYSVPVSAAHIWE